VNCAHPELEFASSAAATDFGLIATVQVRCTSCHLQFHWPGLDAGAANPHMPTVSADGFELRAPIRAGPGSHVGLLESAGLIDRLVDPNEAQAE